MRYLGVALELAGDRSWIDDYDRAWGLVSHLATSEFLAGNFDAANTRFGELFQHARTPVARPAPSCV